MRTALIAIAIVVLIVFLAGGVFVFHFAKAAFDVTNDVPKMPTELATARVLSGEGVFAKAVYYTDPGLGVVTDIERTQTGEPVIVGHAGAAFLSANGSASKKIQFDRCEHDVTLSDLAGGSFLCRGSWDTGASLIGLDGKTLWAYTVFPGVDDAASGTIGAGGAQGVVVGFPGGTGIRLISPQGKELWSQKDGNVWHVEIAPSGNSSGNVIVHSNAAGQITLRDANGTVLARSQPEIYLSDFSLTAWKDDSLRNKLIAAQKGSFYVLSQDGKTVTRLSAPKSMTDTDEASGIPVHFSKGTPYYAALVRNTLWSRSVLYIYDQQDQPVYSEVIDQDCAAFSALGDSNGNQDLLLGCNGVVWKYSPTKR